MKKQRVFLADDDDDVRDGLQEGLEKRGLEVVPASTVAEALSLIAAEAFDVLLDDLHMPDAANRWHNTSLDRFSPKRGRNGFLWPRFPKGREFWPNRGQMRTPGVVVQAGPRRYGPLVSNGLTCYHPRHCGPYPAW